MSDAQTDNAHCLTTCSVTEIKSSVQNATKSMMYRTAAVASEVAVV